MYPYALPPDGDLCFFLSWQLGPIAELPAWFVRPDNLVFLASSGRLILPLTSSSNVDRPWCSESGQRARRATTTAPMTPLPPLAKMYGPRHVGNVPKQILNLLSSPRPPWVSLASRRISYVFPPRGSQSACLAMPLQSVAQWCGPATSFISSDTSPSRSSASASRYRLSSRPICGWEVECQGHQL